MEEKAIIKELKEGDPAAFDAIYNKYSRRLYNLALGLLKDPYSAGEIVQEVFVKLWEKRSQVNVELNFENYIVTIACNSIRNNCKRKSIEAKVKDYLRDNSPVSINNTDSSVLYNELFELACKTIDKLPAQQKTVYNLNRQEGMKIKQIARTLNISPRTAENHLSKALKYLKEELAKTSLTALVIYTLYVFI
ncbi:MAG: RNA polymerase sigma-70 factor [Bacteroidales bacterium]